MLIAFIIFFIVFIILGLLSFSGKLTGLIIGKRSNSPEEGNGEENSTAGEPVYDEKAIDRFLGVIMLLLALSALLGVFGNGLAISWMVIAAPILFIAVLLFALIYVNTDNRFRKDKKKARRYRK